MAIAGDSPYAQLLADLLVYAQHHACDCGACVTLRASWTLLDVERAVAQTTRPTGVCAACWEADTPVMRQLRHGLVALTTIDPERCALCGLPQNDEAPRSR